MLKTYNKCVKQGKYDSLNEVFYITKKDGEWLCCEDKRLYNLQIESRGQVGYITGKAASSKTIHPSKRRKMSLEPTVLTTSMSTCQTTATTSTSESDRISRV